MHPDFGVGGVMASNIHAVRGKLSHSALCQAGMALRDIPLGDPGYLAPGLLGIARAKTETKLIGVVPHYVDRLNANFRRLMAEPGVVDLNVHDDPVHILRAMAECDCVISSSLHGLIFAEAMEIPNLWVKAGDEIAGGAFKFNDWFSTMSRPQTEVHVLRADDSAQELAKRAALHESTIDVEAVEAAFPTDRLEELCEAEARELLPVEACRSRPTPVFLISFNRGAVLEKVVTSIDRLDRPTEIIVHDNGSTDTATLAVLDKLERNGARVVRRQAITSADDLNRVDETVQEFFSTWAEPSRYIVSDGDIDMAIAAPKTLDVYDELLNTHRQVACVGPMLRIRDIPIAYPLYNRVINRHIEQFWHQRPEWSETSFGPVAYLHTAVDTTFAMQRAGEPYRRLKEALRVYEPYEARHLDWYLEQIGNDVYSSTSSAAISHWNNVAELEIHKGSVLAYNSYFVVRKNKAGVLEVCEERVVQKTGPIQPFAEATEEQRQARIAYTEALRQSCATDIGRWQNAASHYQPWQQRGVLLAGFVRSGERVFEFGAGNSALPDALPDDCHYVGSDAAPLREGVMRFDLNAPALSELDGHDVAVFSGVLEYVHDLPRLATFLSRNFRTVVCSYAPVTGSSSEEIERRRYSGWFTDLSDAEFTELFRGAGYRLTDRAEWTGQALYRWDRA